MRTSTLLRRLVGEITWLTANPNGQLFDGCGSTLWVDWSRRATILDRQYDLVLNLEDEAEVAAFVGQVRHSRLFGAYVESDGALTYTDDSRGWFDLSLISKYGRQRADALKLQNRRTYQDLLFEGLNLEFRGETYVLPNPAPTDLTGDVALAPVAGAVWPMKAWAFYDHLKAELECLQLRVNVLPRRASLQEHLADVRNHRCLVSGDSLPMHLALGTGTACVTLFNCTSPWEIYDYGVQTKIVSPLLDRFFYKRGFDEAATTSIRLDDVFHAVMERLKSRVATGTMRPD